MTAKKKKHASKKSKRRRPAMSIDSVVETRRVTKRRKNPGLHEAAVSAGGSLAGMVVGGVVGFLAGLAFDKIAPNADSFGVAIGFGTIVGGLTGAGVGAFAATEKIVPAIVALAGAAAAIGAVEATHEETGKIPAWKYALMLGAPPLAAAAGGAIR